MHTNNARLPQYPLISVIIPTFNRFQWLHTAIESVRNQTYPNLEILLIDDGSSDETAEFYSKSNDLHYIRQENTGVSAARNHGMRVAKGQWFAFLDSDDQWLPEKIERQFERLSAADAPLLCHTDEIWVRAGKRVNPMKKHAKMGGYIFENCLPLCCISPSSVVVHRKLIEAIGPFDVTLPACEDYDLWLRICAQYPVAFIEHPLLRKYGGHADQLSKKYWGIDRFRIQALEKLVQHTPLTHAQRHACLKTLQKKISIFLNGARKRNQHENVALYTEKLNATTQWIHACTKNQAP